MIKLKKLLKEGSGFYKVDPGPKRWFKPYGDKYTEYEKQVVLNAMNSETTFTQGTELSKFEKKFSRFIGTKYAVAVNSGTAALHLALLSCNFPKNKKVLVPTITFSATAAAALYCGLKPKFVDIRKEDLTIDFDDLKKKYTKDCVAIICVHMGGHPI